MSLERSQFGWLLAAALPALALLTNSVLPPGVPAANTTRNDAAPSSAAELAAAAQAVVEPLEFQVAPPAVLLQASEEVVQKGELLALIANAVALEYGEVTWKSNALSVRDAAIELAKAAAEKDSSRASDAVKKMKELMAGGDSGHGESPRKEPLEMITLHHVMLEIQNRYDPLGDQVKSPEAFHRGRKGIAQDAGVLALLATALRTDVRSAIKAMKPQGAFERLAGELYAASASLQQAAWDGKYEDAAAARNSMGKVCADCHRDYRPQ